MTSSNDSRQPPVLADFPLQTYDKVRYADTDRQGHVNNGAFSNYLETGRVEVLYNPDRPLAADGCSFVIANLSLAFRAEIRWPGRVDIGTACARVGRSSCTLTQALFQGGQCVATAETVIVQVDNRSHTASSLSDEARAVLEGAFQELRRS